MNDGIFLISDDEELHELNNQPYDTEDILQSLLAKHPELLRTNEGASQRWLLISREMPIPSTDDSTYRWSVDHLFLDQSGVPTLVEVKRSSDSRIRREVVGQMLDYAANAVMYWPIERIQDVFTKQCETYGVNADAELDTFLSGAVSVLDYWQKVKTNLQAGRVRLVFVADEIPSELKRIVEFLNEQMDPAEVLALELKQYVEQGTKLLISNIIGQTSQAQQRKNSGVSRRTGKLGAKDFIRQQITDSGVFRMQDGLVAGYTQNTLQTALSDLKNPKYCGPAGTLLLKKAGDGSYTL
ncbi:hypothetical protein JZ785_18760 [Alicyclobacillus curvatus]|nr:hypothetical protein JZ785_18760 [Alicyclobacillus curvatus]